MTTQVGAWTLHEGAAGDDLPPPGEVGLGSDGNWWTRTKEGRVLSRRAAKQAVIGAGETAVGSYLNDAVIIEGAIAEDACAGTATSGWEQWPSVHTDASDIYDLVTPGGDIAGISATVYVQWKSPPNAVLAKAVPQGADVAYFRCKQVDQTKLSPVPGSAQQGNCAPPLVWDPTQQRCECPAGMKDDGKGGCVGTTTNTAGWPTWAKVAAGVGAGVVVIGGGVLLMHHQKKHRHRR